MFERYYRETSNGDRLLVTEEQWAIDRYHGTYKQMIAQPGLTIYTINR